MFKILFPRTFTLVLPSSAICFFLPRVFPSSAISSSLERPQHQNAVLNLHRDIPHPRKRDVWVPGDGCESGQHRRIQNVWNPYSDVQPRTGGSLFASNLDAGIPPLPFRSFLWKFPPSTSSVSPPTTSLANTTGINLNIWYQDYAKMSRRIAFQRPRYRDM